MNALRAGVEGTVIAGKLLEKTEEESLGGRLGYNAATDVFEDLVAVGVIDPVKVRLPLHVLQACVGHLHALQSPQAPEAPAWDLHCSAAGPGRSLHARSSHIVPEVGAFQL